MDKLKQGSSALGRETWHKTVPRKSEKFAGAKPTWRTQTRQALCGTLAASLLQNRNFRLVFALAAASNPAGAASQGFWQALREGVGWLWAHLQMRRLAGSWGSTISSAP